MSFQIINFQRLQESLIHIRQDWNDPSKPFRYFIVDNFFNPNALQAISDEYPDVTQGAWDGTTYLHQKNKFTMNSFDDNTPFVKKAFDELNSPVFLKYLESITGIEPLLADESLFGGGLHQSINGAFLDVHVDFNIHEKTGHHRRLNAIVYMNKNWKDEYNGFLELWDMDKKKLLEKIAPDINRLVVFETNEVSYHGHPKPLNTPQGLSRKSLATYYYTEAREIVDTAQKHNTIYVNTEGVKGNLKTFFAGIKASFERLKGKK